MECPGMRWNPGPLMGTSVPVTSYHMTQFLDKEVTWASDTKDKIKKREIRDKIRKRRWQECVVVTSPPPLDASSSMHPEWQPIQLQFCRQGVTCQQQYVGWRKETSSGKNKNNYTGNWPEQFWGKTTIHGVLIYQYRSPNNPKQVHCNAAQNAVPTHDAMIASSGTGTAGPLMGTMHSP